MALVDMLGGQLVGKEGKVDTSSAVADSPQIGLYFSAHWCPPCRNFTPVLAEWYTKVKAAGKKIEIVFVSSDRDQKSCDEYYETMPWLCLPFDDRDKKEALGDQFGVRGIPTLVFLNPDGTTASTEGRALVSGDENGDGYPYKS